MHTKHYLLLLLLGLGSLAYGQQFKTVLPRPAKFVRPIDYKDRKDDWENIDDKNTIDRWVVYSDRENNPLFSEPNGSPNGKRMDFKQKAFVVEKKDNWLHLIKWDNRIIVNGTSIRKDALLEDLGWIRRENLLLWEKALVADKSNIHRKVMLVHFDLEAIGQSIKAQGGPRIMVYPSPNPNSMGEEKKIYDFFFVLKKQKGYFLLCHSDNFSPTNAESQIIGWVSEQQASPWNTRIALEPNINKMASLERKHNPDFLFAHYSDHKPAQQHRKTGQRQQSQLWRITDPAIPGRSQSSIEHKMTWSKDCDKKVTLEMNRFEGGLIRFPILAYEKADPYYESSLVGAVGSNNVDESTQAKLERLANEYSSGQNKWNVVFLIDGTREMREYRDELFNTVNYVQEFVSGISKDIKLKTSAVVYRDQPEENAGQLVEEIPPTTSSNLIEKLRETRFYSEDPGDDDFAAYYYGLNKAINLGAFKGFEVNIIIHIGFGGDISNAPVIRPRDHKAFLKPHQLDQIQRKLSENQVAFLSMQWRNRDLRAFNKFVDNGFDLLLGTAQYGHLVVDSLLRQLDQERSNSNPSMTPEPGECGFLQGKSCRMKVENGLAPMHLFTPGAGKYMGSKSIREETAHFLTEIFEFNSKIAETALKVIGDGNDIDDEKFEPAARIKIIDMFHRYLSEEEMKALFDERTRILVKSYVPTSIAGMKYPLSTMVVLMTKRELQETLDRLEELNSVQSKPSDQVRETLVRLLSDQYRKAAGENYNPKTTSMKEYAQVLHGLKDGLELEGIELPVPENWKFDDITNSRKVPDGEILQYTCRVAGNLDMIRSILEGDYPFKFKRSGTEFFWIPIEFTL